MAVGRSNSKISNRRTVGALALAIGILTFSTTAIHAVTCENEFLQMQFTPKMRFWWSPTKFDGSRREKAFMRIGVSSILRARRHRVSIVGQLQIAVAHVRQYVEYDGDCAIKAPGTIDEVLTHGRGACLQINLLTAALLIQSGFKTKIAFREVPEGWGHLWLEVGAGDQMIIVDATREAYAVPVVDLQRQFKDPESFEKRWYLHPDRILRFIQ